MGRAHRLPSGRRAPVGAPAQRGGPPRKQPEERHPARRAPMRLFCWLFHLKGLVPGKFNEAEIAWRVAAWSTLEPQLAAKISYAGIPQEKLRAGVFRGFVEPRNVSSPQGRGVMNKSRRLSLLGVFAMLLGPAGAQAAKEDQSVV